tara:strand:+ start:952 stop:2514 length:1563 start_codon:yes stop_codon:yes gene_type:complete
MLKKFKLYKNKIYILSLFLFSVIINQYYGSLGVFPTDSFHFFDSGYRILNGEVPFIDYWLVKGPLLDYIQAAFFYLFGVNWNAYVFHASIFNAVIAISTFFVLKNFKLNIEYCFLYSLLVSILAYPSSGTPFIDHHSSFFSLLAIYSLLLAINNKNFYYWVLAPILFGLAFLSKQVPAAYIILFLSFILLQYFYVSKKFEYIKYFLIGILSFTFFILIFGKLQNITISSFLDQYIFYPQTIGLSRFSNLSLSLSILEKFIFILISISLLFYTNLKNFFTIKNYKKNNEFFFFLILFSFLLSLVLHQLLTKNQTFIFFLIPIFTAFSQISIEKNNLKYKKVIFYILIFCCLFSTYKYHLRYNEGRKFHELKNVNFNLSIDAKQIDKKLSGLKWITPQYKDNAKEEINFINDTVSILKEDKSKKMLITNYPFFSTILGYSIFSPSRVYTGDGTTHPLKGNKYFRVYEELMRNIVSKNDIKVIYVITTKNDNINFHYVDIYKNCYEETNLGSKLKKYDLTKCF